MTPLKFHQVLNFVLVGLLALSVLAGVTANNKVREKERIVTEQTEMLAEQHAVLIRMTKVNKEASAVLDQMNRILVYLRREGIVIPSFVINQS